MRTGLDPEFFVVDGSNHIIPASRILPSSNGDVAYDNAAIEIRPAPSTCIQGLLGNTRETFQHAYAMMRLARRRGHIPATSRISFAPALRLRRDATGEPTVLQFGCSPTNVLSADGKDLSMSIPKVDAMTFPYRSAGYHVHCEMTNTQAQRYLNTILSALDAFVGLADVMMVNATNRTWVRGSRIRRSEMGYGVAGEHRTRVRQSTGTSVPIVEYRTLSPWPMMSPLWVWWAQSAVRHVVQYIHNGDNVGRMKQRLPNRSEIVEAINSCDPKAATQLWKATLSAFNGGLPGRSGNDALTYVNNQSLWWAITHGGASAYIPREWSTAYTWFRNKYHDIDFIDQRSGRRVRGPYVSYGVGFTNARPRSVAKLYYGKYFHGKEIAKRNAASHPRYYNIPGNLRHEQGIYTTFPSGVDNLITDGHAERGASIPGVTYS